jgi:ABC-type methionine transport system permease subunit
MAGELAEVVWAIWHFDTALSVQSDVMIVTIILLVIIVELINLLGTIVPNGLTTK